MPQKVWKRNFDNGLGLTKALEATRQANEAASEAVAIKGPPENVKVEELLKTDTGGLGFTLSSFSAQDALELGNLLHARLLPFAPERPALISISTATGGDLGAHVLYQSVTGPGTTPDNESWVRRKRATVLRFGVSSWMMGRKLGGDEVKFAAKFGMGPEEAGKYAIHGGGVPIRVHGVEGVVAVVVVSGLKQHEDHGVIAEVLTENWE